MPTGLEPFLERVELPAGTVLLHQGEAPDALFVVASGRLDVEAEMANGTRMRLSSMGPGVIAGEVAMYLGGPRTADVVAREPSVVLRLSRASLERIEAEDPALAVRVHRWLATTLAGRVSDALRAYEALQT
jgi:SulP family sulfate permease